MSWVGRTNFEFLSTSLISLREDCTLVNLASAYLNFRHDELLHRSRDTTPIKASLPAAEVYHAAEPFKKTFSIGPLQALQLALVEHSA